MNNFRRFKLKRLSEWERQRLISEAKKEIFTIHEFRAVMGRL